MDLVREQFGDQEYAYYPLGEHIVSCPGVCRGRPTFKYTRIEASAALGLLFAGYPAERIAREYNIPEAAVEEAVHIACERMREWRVPE